MSDRKAYMREYMREKRAKEKLASQHITTSDEKPAAAQHFSKPKKIAPPGKKATTVHKKDTSHWDVYIGLGAMILFLVMIIVASVRNHSPSQGKLIQNDQEHTEVNFPYPNPGMN